MILPSQGAMEKTIELDKTVAAAEGTITLKQIKLFAAHIQVQAIYTPQGYVMPAHSGNFPLPMSIDAVAEYSVDGSILKKAGTALDQWMEEGIELTWVTFDLVPIDSSELTFRITEIEKLPEQERWQGPWEFTVRLDE